MFASPAASNATAAAVQPVMPTSSPSSTSAEEIMGVEAEDEHDVCKSFVVQFRRCEGCLPPVPQPFSSNWPFAAHANINPPCTFHRSVYMGLLGKVLTACKEAEGGILASEDGYANGASDLFVLEQVNVRGMGITT